MDYQRRPYTASVANARGTNITDQVSYNLTRGESLLEEPDTGFSIGGNFGGGGGGAGMFGASGSGMGSGIGSGIERQPGLVTQQTGNFVGARSNYTGSEMGDSDTQSNIQSRPNWLTSSRATYGGPSAAGAMHGNVGAITEIGTIEVAGGRRTNRFAGGNSSNHSGSMHANRQNTVGSKLFAAGNSGSGYNDILDNELNKPAMSRGRSQNLLSDAGSKSGVDEDEMSHYMGQSALGGASNLGGADVSSNVGGYNRTQHQSAGGNDPGLGRSNTSRRQQVLERNNMNSGSGRGDTDRPSQPALKKQESANYGLFLGGGSVPPRHNLERAKTSDARADQGNTIGSGSNDSLGARPNTGFVRDRSVPFQRAKTEFPSLANQTLNQDANKDLDVRSIGGRSRESGAQIAQASPSPTQNSMANVSSAPIVPQNNSNPNISIHDNKREYLKEKERKDLDALQAELRKEKDRLAKIEEQFNREIESLKEKQAEELSRVESGHKDTLEMLGGEKNKIMGTLQEALEKENTKMEQMHQQELSQKEKVHNENTESLKVQLTKETRNLESQVEQQNELREILESVQKRTVDITEIVESSLRQREDELKRKEIELAKEERQMIEDEVIQIELEEKKLAEEERKLQLTKDVLLKLKQSQNQEINRMREQRQGVMANYLNEEQRLRQEERAAKEKVSIAKKRLEQENEKRSAQNRLIEVELANKESEVQNAQELLEKEKRELETEQRENYIREIQVKQIEIEDRKKLLSNHEHELRRQQRLLEKKRELIEADRQQLEDNSITFEQEKIEFEALAEKIEETSERLRSEREVVLEEKAAFDFEKEQLDKVKHDIDIERSLLHAEFLRAEELEHELIHRENMLKMLLFNKEHKEKQRDAGGLLPPYTSCPNLKMENVQGHNLTALSPGGEFYDRNTNNFSAHLPQQQQPVYNDTFHHSGAYQQPYPQQQPQPAFDYNNYMQELANKLGDYTLFSGRDSQAAHQSQHHRFGSFGSQGGPQGHPMGGQAPPYGASVNHDAGAGQMSPPNGAFSPEQNPRFMGTGEFADPRGMLSSVTKSGRGFREKILAQLGDAQLNDSKFNSNSEGNDYEPTASLGLTDPLASGGPEVKIYAGSRDL